VIGADFVRGGDAVCVATARGLLLLHDATTGDTLAREPLPARARAVAVDAGPRRQQQCAVTTVNGVVALYDVRTAAKRTHALRAHTRYEWECICGHYTRKCG